MDMDAIKNIAMIPIKLETIAVIAIIPFVTNIIIIEPINNVIVKLCSYLLLIIH